MIEVIRVTTEEELEKAFAIRKEVFVEEQGVPEENEIDEYDSLAPCDHLSDSGRSETGWGRKNTVSNGFGKLERICVLKPYRKMGIGKVIVQELEKIAKEKGYSKVKLHSQTHANAFYEQLGYRFNLMCFMEKGFPII